MSIFLGRLSSSVRDATSLRRKRRGGKKEKIELRFTLCSALPHLPAPQGGTSVPARRLPADGPPPLATPSICTGLGDFNLCPSTYDQGTPGPPPLPSDASSSAYSSLGNI